MLTGLTMLLALACMMSIAFAAEPQAWKNQEITVKGAWSIQQRDDGNYVVLSDDFKTRGAPDLKLFVSKTGYDAITGNNATDSSTLVAKLSSNKGGQNYKIPENINLDDYQSLIIHCEQYSKLWASSPLK